MWAKTEPLTNVGGFASGFGPGRIPISPLIKEAGSKTLEKLSAVKWGRPEDLSRCGGKKGPGTPHIARGNTEAARRARQFLPSALRESTIEMFLLFGISYSTGRATRPLAAEHRLTREGLPNRGESGSPGVARYNYLDIEVPARKP